MSNSSFDYCFRLRNLETLGAVHINRFSTTTDSSDVLWLYNLSYETLDVLVYVLLCLVAWKPVSGPFGMWTISKNTAPLSSLCSKYCAVRV